MATQQQVEAAKQEARELARDFARDGEEHLGRITLYCWVYEPESQRNGIALEGDFSDPQRDAIYDAGCELLPV